MVVANGTAVQLAPASASTVAIGCFLCLLIIISVCANGLLCVAVLTEHSLGRHAGNLFLASLAIADLLVATLVMTFALANDLMGYWVFGPTLCDVWVALDVMCCTASILHLCAISLDRYAHIRDPMRYARRVTRKHALAAISLIWLVSAMVSCLPIGLHLHRAGPEPESADSDMADDGDSEDLDDEAGNIAQLPTCSLDLTPLYAVVSSCISFYIPCVVMIALYAQLYRYARSHVRSIRAVTLPLRPSPTTPNSTPPNTTFADHKAAVTLGVLVGSFLICWVPFFCVNVVAALCKDCVTHLLFVGLTWLGYANSALNPLLYTLFNHELRTAIVRLLGLRTRARSRSNQRLMAARITHYETTPLGDSSL